ncbi:MAG: NADH-quinone oxidoreductase subunit N [Chitinophagaceae bacterium]|nr:NADH-quinone oxidoreductase subunit N [Chitinophagaceae bacterium]
MSEFFILLRQELVITLIIFILLFLKLGRERSNNGLLVLINILLLVNFAYGFCCDTSGSLFSDMFHTDKLVALEKNILNLAMLIISLQAYNWLQTHKHVTEFYILLLTTLLGMFFMISSGHLLMFYLGLEMSTIPLAAAANFDLHKKQSSEAAMKLIISSAFSSALLLLGISLVYGATGRLELTALSSMLGTQPLHIFAFILLLSGFAFKISAVPFHLWTADVYEGAPVAVTAYLSVVSKAAVLFVFVSVLYTVFRPLAVDWYPMLMILALLTIIIGNLFALRQQNIKRFLAFSSIAQVGFILVGISGASQTGSASVIFFILVYVFSNLGAFGVVALVTALTGRENIDDYRAFYRNNRFLSWTLTIALFSLAGVPPAAGFFGKFFLLMSGASRGHYAFIAVAALNMVISFYYYLRIVKAIFMDDNAQPIEPLPVAVMPKLALYICLAGVIVTGLWSYLYDYIFSLSPIF